MPGPWERYGQQAAPQAADPVIAPPDPYKQAVEQRAQEDQARQEEQLRLSQAAAARADAQSARQQAQFEGRGGAPTEYQAKSASFLARMLESDRMFGDVPEGSRDARTMPGQWLHDNAPSFENSFNSDDRQKADQAARNFIAASLRQESGAAISASEFENQYRIFFPMPGDGEAVIKQKAEARRQAIEGFRVSAGPLADRVAPAGSNRDPAQAGAALGAQVGSQIGADAPNGGDGTAPPPGGLSQAQQQQLDSWVAGHPNFTPQELVAFAQQSGLGTVNNADEVVRARNEGRGVAPASQATFGDTVGNFLSQAGTATQNALAAGAQGLASAYDFPMSVGNAVERGVNYAVGHGGGALLDTVGLPGAADWWRRGADLTENRLANQPTVSGAIEQLSPTPRGMEGARFAGQLAGSLLIPGPKRVPATAVRAAEDAGVNALARVGRGAKATAEEARTLQTGTGIPIKTTDVIPPRTFLGKAAQNVAENVPIVGTGGGRAAQQEARQQAVAQVLQDYGGLSDKAAIDAVASDLSAQRASALTKWTGVKQAIAERLPGTVPVTRAVAAIDQQIARLQTLRTDSTKAVIAKLQDWRQALQGQGIDNIEAIRREMGAAFTAPDMTHAKDLGEKVVNSLYNPLRDDISAFVESRAGPEAASQWAKANRTLSGMAGEMKMSRLRRVLQSGDTTPEDVGTLLFSAKPSEVRALYNGLSEAGRANARAAIMQRVFRDMGGEIDDISPEKFLSAMRRVSAPSGIVFRGGDEQRMKGLVRALQLTRRAAAASAAPPTGKLNMPFFMGMFASTGAGAPALASLGIGARIYESAPVRDILLRMARTKPGSAQESATFTKLQDIVARMTPAMGTAARSAANDVLAQSPGRLAARENENN